MDFLFQFGEYIDKLYDLSDEKKKAHKQKKADFEATVQAIQTMWWAMKDLDIQLQNKFNNKDIQLINLTNDIDKLNTMFSFLKTNLYNIYDVKPAFEGLIGFKKLAKGKITIEYMKGDKEERYTLDDLLTEIDPSLEDIEKERKGG